MDIQYFDIHSHVTFKDYDHDLEEVLARMREEGVATITVGVDKATSAEAVQFADAHENFYATIGLHPTDTITESFDSSLYGTMAESKKVVGVGECGIDFFRAQGDLIEEKKRQWREFEKQLEFAIAQNLPLMIHCRPSKGSMDAYLELLSRLESESKRAGEKLRGNVHFFVGDVDIARRFYDIGFTTSFTGVLTFAREYDEVVQFAPMDMLLTETDSPFVAPVPFRGKRNEPLYVKYVVQAIAKIRGAEEELVRRATVANAQRVFLPHAA
ncbi:TatD family hydrolase [Patescibacteria group bacterium]|nr:TatD family hydrolase [Patescibacteria group bacterium]